MTHPRQSDTPESRFALEAVRSAALLTRRIQSEQAPAALVKRDRSPVTIADFASQAVVAGRLAKEHPEWLLVGEEESRLLERSPEVRDRVLAYVQGSFPDCDSRTLATWIDRGKAAPTTDFWTLDPVDGTKGFLRGDQYAVALAHIRDGRPVLGVLGCPNLRLPGFEAPGVLVAAARGQGSWAMALDGGPAVRLSASSCHDPERARVLKSFESAHTDFDQIAKLVERLGACPETIAMDSQAKYALLAAGVGELLFRIPNPATPDYREKIWDHAAGALVVEEAGGAISDIDGQPLDFSRGRTLSANRGVLASNGHLHQRALQILAADQTAPRFAATFDPTIPHDK